MKREEYLNELSKKYSQEMSKEYEENNKKLKEREEIASDLIATKRKHKFIQSLVYSVPAMGILALLYSTKIGIVISSILPSFVTTSCIPLILMGASYGIGSIITKAIHHIKKIDERAYNFSNAKTEEDKIQAYLENGIERYRIKNRNRALHKSLEKIVDNTKLINNLAIDSVQMDNSNIAMEQMENELSKEKEKLDQLSIKKAVRNGISEQRDSVKMMPMFGVLFSTVCMICTNASLVGCIATYGVGMAYTGLVALTTSRKTEKAIKNVLKKYNLKEEVLSESSNESIDEVITKIVEYEEIMKSKKILKELNESSEREKEKAASQEENKALENVIIPDSVLEQFTEASQIETQEKVIK